MSRFLQKQEEQTVTRKINNLNTWRRENKLPDEPNSYTKPLVYW